MRRRNALFLMSVPFLLALGWAAAGTALAGGGCHQQTEASATEASSAVVKLDGCTYAPAITRVPIGTDVRWINSSNQTHDITGRRFEWGSGDLVSGASYSQRFTKAGVFPYSCSFHPGMAGIVVVGGTDLTLASDVEAPPAEPVASDTSSGNALVPIVAAAGVGLLGGALVGAAIASRARRENAA
jgi:plastocyanin